MKFLIAIGSREYSAPTLKIGMMVAKAFNAGVTIVYVGEKYSSFNEDQIRLAQESMERWDLEDPGIAVLEWAFRYLVKKEYIAPQVSERGFQKKTLVEQAGARSELFLPGTFAEGVKLIYRRGEIISELRQEVRLGRYDVTIIGGSRKRRMAHDLVQYIDTSILVIKNVDLAHSYRLLLAVDDSRGTTKALNYGIRIAQAWSLPVDVLTVSKVEYFGPGYSGAAARAARYLTRAGIEHTGLKKVGDPVEVIVREAGDDHIIVMGASRMNPLLKFITGSKPVNVMTACNCPILIVK